MNLSKSKYCNAIQCKKMLWLEKYKPEQKEELNNESVLDNGNLVHDLARNLFGDHITIEFNEDLNVMIENTTKALEKEKVVIAEASFNYNDNFCSVDILKKNKERYEIYEVKSSTEVKDIYIIDASYQTYVLRSLGYDVKKVSIVTLNNKYKRKKELELDKLFNISDYTEEVLFNQKEIEENIRQINLYMKQQKEPKDDIDNKCFKPYPCPFFKYCTKNLPKQNIFDIRRMTNNKKIKLYKEGIYTFKDLLNSNIDDKSKQQIEYELNDKKDYIDKEKINTFLNTLTEPLYFLDFETFQSPIPPYDGIKPYDQIPFQYSLHYIENNKLYHKEFLAPSGIDPRRSLAESLVKDIPLDVCTLAYNMSFEKNVIKSLASIYPDLSFHLLNIYNNIKDLMIPFKDRYYYTKEMHGSYSIKYVLPALFPDDESLNYHNLDLIHNGSEAMNSFAKLEENSKQDQEYIRERLLRYCELDTYAMVKIYEKLKEVI